MKRLLRAQWAENDGTVEPRPQQLDAHIDLADIDQAPRVQLVARICITVGPERFFSINAAGQVAPVSRRNIPARDSLEVEDVQRIAGAIDGAIDVLQRSCFNERLNAWQAGIQGTCGQIFYECAPSIHGVQQVAPKKEVGIDLGLEHIATTSDGGGCQCSDLPLV